MSESNSIAHMLAVRGWFMEPKRTGEAVFSNSIKRKLYNGGEGDDIIVINLAKTDHYQKNDNHLFIDFSRDRVYYRQGSFPDQQPNAEGKIFQYVITSRDLNDFYTNIDGIAGGVEQWRVDQLQAKRHTPDQWQKFIEMGVRLG